MKLPKELTTVTPFSKILALILFLTFSLAGFYFGMGYQRTLDDGINPVRPTEAITEAVTVIPSQAFTQPPVEQGKNYRVEIEVKDYFSGRGISGANVEIYYQEPALGIRCTKDWCPPRPEKVKIFSGKTGLLGTASFSYQKNLTNFTTIIVSHQNYLDLNLDEDLKLAWFIQKKPSSWDVVENNNQIKYTSRLVPKTALKIKTADQAMAIAKSATAISSWLTNHSSAQVTIEDKTQIGVWSIKYRDGEKYTILKLMPSMVFPYPIRAAHCHLIKI
ncbi:hypothetical protein HY345_03055 [Candidatus Microgenomates bacterium]|nr:hypothetical protein [Candidatus Microgenomates bacterium]